MIREAIDGGMLRWELMHPRQCSTPWWWRGVVGGGKLWTPCQDGTVAAPVPRYRSKSQAFVVLELSQGVAAEWLKNTRENLLDEVSPEYYLHPISTSIMPFWGRFWAIVLFTSGVQVLVLDP